MPKASLHHGISLGISVLMGSNSEDSSFRAEECSKNELEYIFPFCDCK